MRNVAVLVSLLPLFACSSSAVSDPPAAPLPPAAEIQAFTRITNVVVTPVGINGRVGLLGIDTGDPILLLNPVTFPSAPQVGTIATVTVGANRLTSVPVVTSSASPASPDPDVVLGGLLGCTIICNDVASFDYQAATFTLGAAPAVAGVGADIAIPFTLEGGGTAQLDGTNVTLPKSRIVVDVQIEGTMHTMIVDTGASFVVVTDALYAGLIKDGRSQVQGDSASTTSGTSSISLTRAKTITLGGATVQGAVIAHDTSFDTNLATIATETGKTIEGSLGGTFLTNFFVSIDYPNSTLHLASYADKTFIVDPAASLGITFLPIGTPGDSYVVDAVAKGSDAEAKGVTSGDVVVTVDGQTLAELSIAQASVLVGGQPGATKSIGFGDAKKLANQTVTLKVGDLVTLP